MNIAIITGASSGIGYEFAKQIDAYEGLDELWLIARRRERLKELAVKLKTPVKILEFDLSKEDYIPSLTDALSKAEVNVALLINAAGFGKYGTCVDLTDEETANMIDVNIRSLITLTRSVLPFMNEGSRIINMGSASSFQPLPYFNLYASTKAFVVHFSRALNVELKPRKISVTCVCPGYVRTEFFDVASNTKNSTACTNFDPLYEPDDVVRLALKDSKKGKDMSVYGFTTKIRRLGAKLMPTKLTIAAWLKIK